VTGDVHFRRGRKEGGEGRNLETEKGENTPGWIVPQIREREKSPIHASLPSLGREGICLREGWPSRISWGREVERTVRDAGESHERRGEGEPVGLKRGGGRFLFGPARRWEVRLSSSDSIKERCCSRKRKRKSPTEKRGIKRRQGEETKGGKKNQREEKYPSTQPERGRNAKGRSTRHTKRKDKVSALLCQREPRREGSPSPHTQKLWGGGGMSSGDERQTKKERKDLPPPPPPGRQGRARSAKDRYEVGLCTEEEKERAGSSVLPIEEKEAPDFA